MQCAATTTTAPRRADLLACSNFNRPILPQGRRLAAGLLQRRTKRTARERIEISSLFSFFLFFFEKKERTVGSSGHAVANLRWLDRAPGAVQSPRARPRPRPGHSNCVSGAQLRRARGPARRHSVRPAVRALLTMTPGLARSPVLFCFLPVAGSGSTAPTWAPAPPHSPLLGYHLPASGRDVSVCNAHWEV